VSRSPFSAQPSPGVALASEAQRVLLRPKWPIDRPRSASSATAPAPASRCGRCRSAARVTPRTRPSAQSSWPWSSLAVDPEGRPFASDAVRHAAVAGSTAITLTPWRAPKRAAAAASCAQGDRHQPAQLGWSREVTRHVLCWALAQERFDFRAHGRLLQPFKERASWVETTAGWRLGGTWRFSVEKRFGVTPR